jgi:hypothetical protein
MLVFEGNVALAAVYSRRFDEAKQILEPLVRRMSRVFGPLHPKARVAMGNLALAMFCLGDFDGASRIQESLVHSITELCGERHPETIHATSNFADYLIAAGDWSRGFAMSCIVLAQDARIIRRSAPRHDPSCAQLGRRHDWPRYALRRYAHRLRRSRALGGFFGREFSFYFIVANKKSRTSFQHPPVKKKCRHLGRPAF